MPRSATARTQFSPARDNGGTARTAKSMSDHDARPRAESAHRAEPPRRPRIEPDELRSMRRTSNSRACMRSRPPTGHSSRPSQTSITATEPGGRRPEPAAPRAPGSINWLAWVPAWLRAAPNAPLMGPAKWRQGDVRAAGRYACHAGCVPAPSRCDDRVREAGLGRGVLIGAGSLEPRLLTGRRSSQT